MCSEYNISIVVDEIFTAARCSEDSLLLCLSAKIPKEFQEVVACASIGKWTGGLGFVLAKPKIVSTFDGHFGERKENFMAQINCSLTLSNLTILMKKIQNGEITRRRDEFIKFMSSKHKNLINNNTKNEEIIFWGVGLAIYSSLGRSCLYGLENRYALLMECSCKFDIHGIRYRNEMSSENVNKHIRSLSEEWTDYLEKQLFKKDNKHLGYFMAEFLLKISPSEENINGYPFNYSKLKEYIDEIYADVSGVNKVFIDEKWGKIKLLDHLMLQEGKHFFNEDEIINMKYLNIDLNNYKKGKTNEPISSLANKTTEIITHASKLPLTKGKKTAEIITHPAKLQLNLSTTQYQLECEKSNTNEPEPLASLAIYAEKISFILRNFN